jgi:hypothetical protein
MSAAIEETDDSRMRSRHTAQGRLYGPGFGEFRQHFFAR